MQRLGSPTGISIALLAAVIGLGWGTPALAQAEPQASGFPDVTAASWILYDETFDRELGNHNPDERRFMASTTKIMTALVVLERAGLEDTVTVSEQAADVGEAEIGLVAGEQLSIHDLLVGMLVGSGNDAAMALAEHVGGTVEGFVELMNGRAAELGLDDTHFANPHGLDEPGHFSTARDLLAMSRAAMTLPVFAETVRLRRAPLPNAPNGRAREAQTTNTLLRSYPGAFGIKTGFTGEAGLALVAGADRDARRIFSVVLGSEDHFADTSALLEFGFDSFGPVEVLSEGVVYALRRSGDRTDELVTTASATVFMSDAEAERVEFLAGLVGSNPHVVAAVDGAEVARATLQVPASPPLPDIREAVAWASRYWERLWGTEG